MNSTDDLLADLLTALVTVACSFVVGGLMGVAVYVVS